MGKQSQKFCLLFLFISLSFPLISTNHHLTTKSAGFEIDTSKTGVVIDKPKSWDYGLHQHHLLNERVSKIELNHEEQEKFSALIKTLLSEDRKEINQLRGRVAELEDLVVASITTDTSLKIGDKNSKAINEERIIKRPARLLPLQLLFDQDDDDENKEKKMEEESKKRSYGPATNCTELSKLGYTLNGYYLVNGNKNESNINKNKNIKVVDCRFKKPYEKEGEKQKLETLIGKVEFSDESAIQELRKSLESQVKFLNETVKGLESKVEKVNESMKDEINLLMNATIGFESQVEKANATIKGLESQVRDHQETMKGLESKVEKVNEKIKGLESQIEKANATMKAADDKEMRLEFLRINNDSKSNNIQSRSEEKEDCLFEFKTWNDTCLVAQDGIKTTTTNSGSYLAELSCKSVKKEQQWKRKDLHICSNKNDKCLTVSPNSKVGDYILNLMAYEASAKSQQWIIGSTQSGHNLIVNVETSLCLYDPLYDYEQKRSFTASTNVRSCRRVREYLFSFDLIDSSNRKKCPLVRDKDIEDDIKNNETVKLKMEKSVSKII